MNMTWKEIKLAYLMMLIKEGDLSNSQLDSLIGESQRMTSDRGILHAATIEDMKRIVEAHTKASQDVKRDCPTCRWDCEHGNDHPRWGEKWLQDELEKDGACPIWEQHNANPKYALIPDGMTHEQAVKYLGHGPKMTAAIKDLCDFCERLDPDHTDCLDCNAKKLLAAMEVK